MLFNILPYVLVLAICVKVPMTRRLIMKYPIIPKIGLMLLNFIKDIVFSNERMQGKAQYPNHLNGFNAGGIGSSSYSSFSSNSNSSFYDAVNCSVLSNGVSDSIHHPSNNSLPSNTYYSN